MRGDANGSNHSSPSPARTAIGASPSRKSRLSNGSANGTNSTNGSHMNGDSPIHLRHTQPTSYGHDREELTRILIQSLNDLGYESSAGLLSRESGYDLETGHAAAFRVAVLHGEWAEAEALLTGSYTQEESSGSGGVSIGTQQDRQSDRRATDGYVPQRTENRPLLSPNTDHREMLFLLRKQKYLELLEQRDVPTALHVLQQELSPLNEVESERCAGLMFVQSAEDLRSQEDWDGANGDSRKVLLSTLSRYISPSVMIPEHRMATLLTDLKNFQTQHCLYHSNQHPPSLYTNHMCDRDEFPLETICELDRHKHEVWFLAFSNDGTRLATASMDMVVFIYETTSFRLIHRLADHKDAVVYVSWSPDDRRLITCSKDKTAKIWDTQTGTCTRTLAHHEQPVTTAAWTPDGTFFVTGSHDIGKPLTIWSSQGTETDPLHNFENLHIRTDDCALGAVLNQDLSISLPDSNTENQENRPLRLVAACRETKCVLILDFRSRKLLHRISIDFIVTCVNLSREGDEMLLSIQNGEVWILSMNDYTVKQKFLGGKPGKYVIRSCFGGVGETCVISGGEDSKVSIWHRLTGRALEQLSGHIRGCVNAVAWNRARPTMFASAGDDHKVRIWHKPLPSAELAALQASANQPALPPGASSVNQQSQQQNMTGSTSSFASDMSDTQQPQQPPQPPTWGSGYPAMLRRDLAPITDAIHRVLNETWTAQMPHMMTLPAQVRDRMRRAWLHITPVPYIYEANDHRQAIEQWLWDMGRDQDELTRTIMNQTEAVGWDVIAAGAWGWVDPDGPAGWTSPPGADILIGISGSGDTLPAVPTRRPERAPNAGDLITATHDGAAGQAEEAVDLLPDAVPGGGRPAIESR